MSFQEFLKFKNFDNFLQEMAAPGYVAMDDEFFKFISKAEDCSKFNLNARDFATLEHKDKIRYLISKNWFPGFDGFVSSSVITKGSVEKSINALRNINLKRFKQLFGHETNGLGNGEILMYYIFDEVTIGGGSSAGVDVICGQHKYELKAVQIANSERNGYNGTFLYDYKLGGTVDVSGFIKRLKKLVKDCGIESMSKTKNEVNNSMMKALNTGISYTEGNKTLNSRQEFQEIENEFRDLVYKEYFSGHEYIFFSNKKKSKPDTDGTSLADTAGDVVYVGPITKDMIYMDRVTSGTLKPMIKIK